MTEHTNREANLNAGAVLWATGHSETRLVRYVSDFDSAYCYEELEEGYNNLHKLLVANAYDADFDEWLPTEKRL